MKVRYRMGWKKLASRFLGLKSSWSALRVVVLESQLSLSMGALESLPWSELAGNSLCACAQEGQNAKARLIKARLTLHVFLSDLRLAYLVQ